MCLCVLTQYIQIKQSNIYTYNRSLWFRLPFIGCSTHTWCLIMPIMDIQISKWIYVCMYMLLLSMVGSSVLFAIYLLNAKSLASLPANIFLAPASWRNWYWKIYFTCILKWDQITFLKIEYITSFMYHFEEGTNEAASEIENKRVAYDFPIERG